MQIFLRYSRS